MNPINTIHTGAIRPLKQTYGLHFLSFTNTFELKWSKNIL